MDNTKGFNLARITSLFKNHVKVRDIDELAKKIKSVTEGGSQLLQVITDFDRTLTKSNVNGAPNKSTHAVFETCLNLPESFVKQCQDLCKKYHPIEMSPHMSVEEKIPYMIEWWKLSESISVGLVIEKSSIDKAVDNANVQFRDGCSDIFKKLNENSVPLLVFSAGIGDVITSILRRQSFDYKNVHVISNFFQFEGSKITGYCGPPIHIYNKNQHAVKNSKYFDQVKHRTSVILMGDSLGDANMAEGLPEYATVLKIGFLSSEHNDEYLPQYMEKFDMVLVDDETMEIPLEILQFIL